MNWHASHLEPLSSPEFASGAPDPAHVDPAVLGALLHRHGWLRRGGAAGRYGRWTPPAAHASGSGGTSLLVPESRTFPDCADLLEEALTALSRSALPSAREVLYGLSVPSDEVRWEREIPEGAYGLRGEADWTVQEQLRSAARRLLLAGALADRARAGYYGARHRAQAERALEGVLVGPAPGGRRLAAYVPVDGGRGTVTRLHHALHAAREAVDYRRATGGMEAFDAAVRAGVSRELADALIALVRGSEGARIALAWAPAAGVPAGCAARPEPVEFSPGDLPVLREAAARYTRTEPAVPVRIAGAVVRMRRSAAGGGGTVRLRVLAGAEIPYVRVALDEEAYRVAGHAHLVGLPVRVSGRLQRRGGFRRLADVTDVTPVPLDEVERDRLMKSMDAAFDPEDVLPSDD
ncbi:MULTISPECIES: hypothetical protein [unclassified Streptomyces]|uniref:hypothetical protein n=1 Tax=unclassified Streptomyces TaxID=2593676 RepID=UPI00224FF8A5|nr:MULTISPECIES: hypothetical protein [unclassified Streptomyces]MCX5016412.1 hypothetical protein [Streptomyces sp. NBC_00555]MCX5608963.1 hypothetical protein [Streptomyces sp. NBC_00047]